MLRQNQCMNVVLTVTMFGNESSAGWCNESAALTVQFHHILKKIVITKESMGDLMKTSSFGLTEAIQMCCDAYVKALELASI
ncbi:hypothetical protein ACOSQ2_024252 [Xanthoceras sorbifolium]